MGRWSLKKEVGRKVLKFFWLFVLIAFIQLEKSYGNKAFLWLVGLLLVMLLIDHMKTEFNFRLPVFHRVLRKKDMRKGTLFTGTTTLFGMIITLAVFERNIAIAAICMMVIGDFMAGLVGTLFGGIRFKNGKSLSGSTAELITNIIVGYFILSSLPVIIAMALTATFIETITTKLDDNMLTPLFAAFVGQLLI